MKLHAAFVYFCWIVITVAQADVCSQEATDLFALTSRGPKCKAEGNVELVSDRSLHSGWYSVSSLGGPTFIMVDNSSIPQSLACGTVYPIYLADSHPSLLDGQSAEMMACYVTFQDNCDDHFKINVRRCNGMYEYELVPTSSNSGYCFEMENAVYEGDKDGCPKSALPINPQSTQSTQSPSTGSGDAGKEDGPSHKDSSSCGCEKEHSFTALIVVVAMETVIIVGYVIYRTVQKCIRNKSGPMNTTAKPSHEPAGDLYIQRSRSTDPPPYSKTTAAGDIFVTDLDDSYTQYKTY